MSTGEKKKKVLAFLFTDVNDFLLSYDPIILTSFLYEYSKSYKASYFFFFPLFFSVFDKNWSAFCLDICKQPLLGKM